MAANVIFTAGSLPVGFCHTDWQSTFDQFIAVLSGVLPGGYSTFNFGSSTPAVEDQDKPWLKTNVDGTPVGWMIFSAGSWVRAEPLETPPGVIVDYFGAESDVPLLNGGTIPSPFWRICDGTNGTPDLRGRTVVGSGQGSGLTLRAMSDFGGEEEHTLIDDEVALKAHTHNYTVDISTNTSSDELGRLMVDSSAQSVWTNLLSSTKIGITRENVETIADPHQNMQPFYCLHKIMRTNRMY